MALFWQWEEKLKPQSPVNNQNPKDDLIILFRFRSTLESFLPSYTHVTGPYMAGHQYTPAEYTLQWILKSFGDLLFQSKEYQLAHMYHVVSCFCELQNVDYVVLRYLNTGI